MTGFSIKRGDRLPRLAYQLISPTGAIADLTGCTVVFNMQSADGSSKIARAPVTITGVLTGEVEYSWAILDTYIAGAFLGEFEVIYPGGLPMTYPNSGYIKIDIAPDLG